MKRRPDSCDGFLCPECAPLGCVDSHDEDIAESDALATIAECIAPEISTERING